MNAENNDTKSLIQKKHLFFGVVFLAVFTLLYAFCFAIDFVPEAPQEETSSLTVVDSDTERRGLASAFSARENTEEEGVWSDPLPSRIIIDTLDIDVEVLNPLSRDIDTLDRALKAGVVRHPDSGDFRDGGNMFLFGHSSYLPTVYNSNYRAFNGIQKLEKGEQIRVQSEDAEYVYEVVRVSQVDANVAEVLVGGGEDTLTLVTCNSFGSKDDRFVVEAKILKKNVL